MTDYEAALRRQRIGFGIAAALLLGAVAYLFLRDA